MGGIRGEGEECVSSYGRDADGVICLEEGGEEGVLGEAEGARIVGVAVLPADEVCPIVVGYGVEGDTGALGVGSAADDVAVVGVRCADFVEFCRTVFGGFDGFFLEKAVRLC